MLLRDRCPRPAMLVACLIKEGKKEARTFSTMTDDLLRLLDWLTVEGCRQVAIESTGVYWRPVFNILEGSVEVMLVNARDAKGFKARKTDVIDAEWLADAARGTDCSSRVSSRRCTSAS